MKKIISILFCCLFAFCFNVNAQFLNRLKQTVVDHTNDKVDEQAGEATDKAIDKTKSNFRNDKDENAEATYTTSKTNTEVTNSSIGTATTPSIHAYQNYDFVPGDTVLFADDFTEDQNGEFPAHWNLTKGQAVVNTVAGNPAFLLTDGNYCQVSPRMKTSSYLTDPFTIEFDYYANDGDGPGVSLFYKDKDGNDEEGYIEFSTRGAVSTYEMPNDFDNNYPNEDDATFRNKWHHAALIYKNNQVKCYVDQYRILVIPSLNVTPISFGFAGIGDQEKPIILTNVRLASGGKMNMLGKKFTEAKIVTHGITFDIDKSEIKPESMGTLNMIVSILKGNPSLKFEIDGHTDNSGQAAHNLILSQQRAEAVKTQLTKMGIDGSRLSTKGFGDTKPISDNTTTEGKANNRRVEFVKI